MRKKPAGAPRSPTHLATSQIEASLREWWISRIATATGYRWSPRRNPVAWPRRAARFRLTAVKWSPGDPQPGARAGSAGPGVAGCGRARYRAAGPPDDRSERGGVAYRRAPRVVVEVDEHVRIVRPGLRDPLGP